MLAGDTENTKINKSGVGQRRIFFIVFNRRTREVKKKSSKDRTWFKKVSKSFVFQIGRGEWNQIGKFTC